MSPPTRPKLRPLRRARGQAAAMMAVTMMLIAIMVCLTLGIGMKVREKAEAQTLADTSAYSGAVLTARTFNSIAILNRVEAAEMVSLIATQSLVSYAGYYRAMVWAVREMFQRAHDAPGICPDLDACTWCTRFQTLINAADAEIARINGQWDLMDGNGNRRVNSMVGQAGGVFGAQQALYDDLIQNQIVGAGLPPLANAITQRVDQGSSFQGELSAPATVNPVNGRELGVAPGCSGPNLVCRGGPAEISLNAAMGARWYKFERDASNLAQTVEDSIIAHHPLFRLNGDDTNVISFMGSTRFVNSKVEHGAMGGLGVMGEAIEGTMQLKITSNGCGPSILGPVPVGSYVYSTSYLNANDDHYYTYLDRNLNTVVYREPQGNHQLSSSCIPPIAPCGMWPGFMDMNPEHADPGSKFVYLYGQPKVTSVVQRDYTVRGQRADPWNLLYTVNIRPSDQEEFNNNGMRTAGNIDISRQTAIATGLVYYHRQFHWREPPNFWNPYWHATLVSGAIDLDGNPFRGGQDLQTAVSGAPFAKDVINDLWAQGFRGWQ